MTDSRPEPVIGKLVVRVWGSGILGSTTSPRSPLESMKIQSQKGLKRYDFDGSVGLGLGIVAALEKSEPPVHQHHKPVFARNRSRSIPVPEVEMEKNETFVTCHGPNKTHTSTRVYYDGDDCIDGVNKRQENINNGFDKKGVKSSYGRVVFEISPARLIDDVEAAFPESDFLSFCNLCRKNLQGKDIYMYNGEKAFCSEECRKVEIVKDKCKEKQQHLGSKLVSSRSNTTTASAAAGAAAATDISTTSPYNMTTTTTTTTTTNNAPVNSVCDPNISVLTEQSNLIPLFSI